MTTIPAVATPAVAPSPSTPTLVGNRYAALDVLRGIAILGTLATNIGMFLMPGDEPSPQGRFHEWFGVAYGLVTDGKWIGLLTIMFGIGLEIQRQSAVRRGDPWLGSYPWRAALLILDGLLNYIFIFEFDVLMGYGLTGLVMCFVLATTPRVQAWVMALGITIHLAFLTWMSRGAWQYADSSIADIDPKLFETAPADLTAAQLRVVADAWELTPKEYAAEWQRMETSVGTMGPSTYWGEVHDRVTNFISGRGEIPIMFTMGMGLFLVGAFLYRAGIFDATGARLRWWVMGLSFGIGLPVDFITRIWFFDYTNSFNRYFTSACVSVGLLALVAHFYVGGQKPGTVGRQISLVGRMALSCYVAQNLIASILFKEWGFNLTRFLHWGEYDCVIGLVVVGAILIVFAKVWLHFFSRGPLEWLWHLCHTWLVQHTTMRVLARR